MTSSQVNKALEAAQEFAQQKRVLAHLHTTPVPGTRPMGGRTSHTSWGSSKIQRTLSVTDSAWELWTEAAERCRINRSELFEVLARTVSSMDVNELRGQALGMVER